MKLMRLGAALGYALIGIYLWPSKVAAVIVNATIDDQLGDSVTHRLVNYYPSQNAWNKQSCGACSILPDTSQVFDGTYTAATYLVGDPTMEINMQFNGRYQSLCLFRYPDRRSTGTAIYVFFILGHLNTSPVTLNSANFTLDSNQPVLFESNANYIQYDVLAFSQSNLSNTLHTLFISTSGPGTYGPIYVNFDYAIYTYDNGLSTTTSSLSSLSTVTTMSQAPSTTATGAPARRTPVGAIAGGIAGGITLLALVISLLFCWRRRGGYDFKGNGDPEYRISQFMATITAAGGESPLNTDNQANMHNNHRMPSLAEKALPSTLNSSAIGASSSNTRTTSPLLPSFLNDLGTQEEVRRARQEDLEQIRVLREQQQSVWAMGLSDDHPPGYTPRMQILREASS
ncbi:uncharacterized protein LACBIDRAFT_294668 [Laccaria bicolor S238N-H82]|uniref:Predicted protein n=1 Tax=Laccaria bicolor (strain S238N-H82 / ATCC MYA-4686) TaxID=486041 RepID=B0DG80_LACBS|nr:uncharacterized protein LACBIDRAFT_294668 [Laccaria bicolor S238N-H82]EDR06466.1 predicted protein [Laccaria bicolor S238N-H82]|eukprot:XP_001882838.1 predicted protein [Laccaria bicolor S238N-H82]